MNFRAYDLVRCFNVLPIGNISGCVLFAMDMAIRVLAGSCYGEGSHASSGAASQILYACVGVRALGVAWHAPQPFLAKVQRPGRRPRSSSQIVGLALLATP